MESTFKGWKEKVKLGDVGKVGGGLVGGVITGEALCRNAQQEHHNRHTRDNERTTRLNSGALNPVQYVSSCADDKLHPQVIKEKLLMWGQKWKGCEFANGEEFFIEPIKIPSSHGFKRLRRGKDESYRLTLHPAFKGKKGEDHPGSPYQDIKGLGSPFTGIDPPDNPLVRSGSIGNPPMGWLHGGGIGNFPMGGLRNGYRPSTEQQILLEEVPEMTEKPEITRYEYLSSPNVSCEVSEGYTKDFSDETATTSYLIRVPDTFNPVLYYPIGIGLVFGGLFLLERIAGIVSKRFTSKESQKPISPPQAFKRPPSKGEGGEVSQESASSLKETVSAPTVTVSFEEFKRLRGERLEREALEAEKKQRTVARPEFLLEIFTRYKRRTITKGAAARVLMNCYHLSEAEALEWLDKK